MTISFSNFDGFEKPKNAASESADAEFKAGDFAAFFNGSAFVPPVNAPVKFAAPQSSGELTVANQPIESNASFFKKDILAAPVFSQNTSDSFAPNLALPNNETLPDSKFTQPQFQPKQALAEIPNNNSALKENAGFQISAKSQSVADDEFPTIPQREPAPSLNGEKSANQKTNVPPLLEENLNVAAANNFAINNAEEIKIAAQSTATIQNPLNKDLQTEPFISQNDAAQTTGLNQPVAENSFKANFTEPNLTLANPPKASLAEEISGQNPAVEKDFGSQVFAVRQNVADDILPAIFRRDFAPPPSKKVFPARTQIVNAEINQASTEFSREKVSSNVPKLFSETAEVNQIQSQFNRVQPDFNQDKKSNDAPILFSDVSAVVKADDLVKANSAPDFVTGEKIVAPTLQIVSGESGRNLHQPETESAKVEKQFETQANPGGQLFNNLLNSVTNKPEIIETAAPVDGLSGKVFEQVEPRIFEVAAAMQSGEEKRFLKMRLNPAELGAVEITLEKNAAGVINAHFQTESDATRQVLNESLAQLRDSLENSGWQVGSLEISCDSSSSNGGERRKNQSEQFGTAENQLAGTVNSGGKLNTEDDQNRLVSLRA